MLVLTRKSQQQIQIGDDIVVSIIRVKGNAVRVGIEAPRDVRVVRAELPRFDAEPPASSPSASGEEEAERDAPHAADAPLRSLKGFIENRGLSVDLLSQPA